MFNWLKRLFDKHNRFTGIMNAATGYRCSECKEFSSNEAWSRNWDWAGPHCPKCGSGGMGQFANVVEQDCPKGVRSK